MYEYLGVAQGYLDKLTLDHWSGIFAIAILIIIILINKHKVKFQPVVGYLIYMVLFPTRYGLGLMDRIANKYRELVKLYGYISIGVGFVGMLFIVVTLLITVLMWVFRPESQVSQEGFALVLPFTNVPGIGYLSFWHFFISIFVLAFFHELAHGIVARAHDIELKSTGFAFLGIIVPLFPAAFVEPNEEKMKKKSDIVQYSVFAAGPMANFVLAFIFALLFIYAFAPMEDAVTEPIGFSYEILDEEDNPSVVAGIPEEGIINSLNNKEIKTYNNFAIEMRCLSGGENITLGINNETYELTTITHPQDNHTGFIGISGIQNEGRILEEYEEWQGPVVGWLTDLMMWLFILNFAVGLINLLPMGPVDGGRMFGLALEKIMGDEKKAYKIWSYVGILFFAIIILGLIFTYIGNPFVLLK
ncbi:MAG: site-2 protease family protein [Candidatus Nanoarchaeia archaeon]